MTIAALIAEVREDITDDVETTKRHSDTQMIRFANEAIKEACIRAPLLVIDKTFSVLVSTAEYTMDAYVRQVINAKLSLDTYALQQSTKEELAMWYGSNWKTKTGTPTHYLRTNRVIRLYPIPIVVDSMVLTQSRIPDTNFNIDTDIDPTYYDSIKWYIAYKCFSNRDADNFDPVKASEYMARFESQFGTKHSAKYDTVSYSTPMYATAIGGRMC